MRESVCVCLCGWALEGHLALLPANPVPYPTSAARTICGKCEDCVAVGGWCFSTSPKQPSGHLAKINAKCQQCGFGQRRAQGGRLWRGFGVIMSCWKCFVWNYDILEWLCVLFVNGLLQSEGHLLQSSQGRVQYKHVWRQWNCKRKWNRTFVIYLNLNTI